MKLTALAARAGLAVAQSGADAQVTGFAIDNRKVAPGTVFGAFQGTQVNGEISSALRLRQARWRWSPGLRLW